MTLELNTLLAIDDFSWLVYFSTLGILFYIFLKQKTVSSSLIVILITTVITWFMNEYREFMLTLIADKKYAEQNRTLIRYAWYYGFTAFNAVIIYSVYKAHVVLKLSYAYAARYLMFAHFILSILQITRCFERQSFATDYLELVYKWGIVGINISCAVVAISFALIALHRQLNSKITRGFL